MQVSLETCALLLTSKINDLRFIIQYGLRYCQDPDRNFGKKEICDIHGGKGRRGDRITKEAAGSVRETALCFPDTCGE